MWVLFEAFDGGEIGKGCVMDAKLKADWVKALRSGEYQQTTANLVTDDGFCCLGVLNVVLGATQNYCFDSKCGLDVGAEGALICLNDDDGKTFAEIADYIEANL